MKKSTIIIIFLFFLSVAFGQNTKVDNSKSTDSVIQILLTNVSRDSTDKKCQQLLSDFYDCFESDEGQASPAMIPAVVNLFKYKDDLELPNRQLAVLLYQYTNSVSEPEEALKWIHALKEEYSKIYGQTHPLIFLYEGESLINAGRRSEAHLRFIEFQKAYPQSVTAMCYIYETESDKNLAKTWLSILRAEHPNHWIVKMYKDR